MPSRSIRWSATVGSKLSMRTRQAPWEKVDRGMQSPPQVPVIGKACRTWSVSVTRSASPAYQPWGTAFLWLIRAPFGKDVVPEV